MNLLGKVTKKFSTKNKPKSNPQLNRLQNFHDSREKSQGSMTAQQMYQAYTEDLLASYGDGNMMGLPHYLMLSQEIRF